MKNLNIEIGHIRPANMTTDPESLTMIVICLPIINSDIALNLIVLLVLVLAVYFFSGPTVDSKSSYLVP